MGFRTTYLAGPIFQQTDGQAKDWRAIARAELCDVLDPLSRDYRGREDDCVAELVEQDKADVEACDIVLANCLKPSAGTSMEVLWAWLAEKEIVVIANRPTSPWLTYHATVVVTSLEDAIAWIKEAK